MRWEVESANCKTGLSGNNDFAIPTSFQTFDVMEKFNRAMLTTGEVFHEAHDQAVLSVRLDHESGDLALSQYLVGFQSTLAAD